MKAQMEGICGLPWRVAGSTNGRDTWTAIESGWKHKWKGYVDCHREWLEAQMEGIHGLP